MNSVGKQKKNISSRRLQASKIPPVTLASNKPPKSALEFATARLLYPITAVLVINDNEHETIMPAIPRKGSKIEVYYEDKDEFISLEVVDIAYSAIIRKNKKCECKIVIYLR